MTNWAYLANRVEENRKAIEAVSNAVESLVSEQVEAKIQARITGYKKLAAAFSAGCLFLVLLDLGLGREVSSRLHDLVKPPVAVYEQIADTMELERLHRVKTALPGAVWAAVLGADTVQFAELAGNERFLSGVEQAVSNRLVALFGANSGPRGPFVAPELVRHYGDPPRSAVLTIVAGEADGEETICSGRTFEHQKLQAIAVVPSNAVQGAFGWLGCRARHPRETWLSITVGDGDRSRSVEVLLQGVEAGGSHSEIELRLSQAAARELGLPGWMNYTVLVYDAEFQVARVGQ